MNFNTLFLILLLPLRMLAGHDVQPQSPFRPLSLQEALAVAAKEQKMVMVHFSASWCMPCQWMEKNTFTDPALKTYLQERFVAVKLDFDDPKGQAEAAQYRVNKLPTILIFNAMKQLIGTHQEMMEAERLLQVLQRYAPGSTPVGGGISAPRAQTDHLNRPQLVVGNQGNAPKNPAGPTANPSSAGSATRTATYPTNERKPAEGLYTSNYPPKKYGIQVGAFSGIENADYMKAELEARYRLPVIVIQDSAPGRASFYKVVIGAYGSEKEAMPLLDRLLRDQRQGYIREY